MADERIIIDYISRYITEGEAQSARANERFNKQLEEQAYVTKQGAVSITKLRQELERTEPTLAAHIREWEALNRAEEKNGKLTTEQAARRRTLRGILKAEQEELRKLVREQEKADQERTRSMSKAAAENERSMLREMRALEQLRERHHALGNDYIKNARKTSIYRQQIDNLTLRSTRRAISGVHEWVTTLGTIIAPAIPQFLSLLSGALGTVATAAVGAASALAKLGPGIGAAGVAISGIVQATNVWKLAMRDMDKLIESAMFDNIDDFVKKLEDFTPAAQTFAVTMRTKVKPALTEWQRIAQGNIFGGINRGVNALLPHRGVVSDIVRQTSAAMGGAIGDFGQELARPEWVQAFRELGTNNAQWIKELGAAAIPTARALRDLTLAGQPIIDWAVEATGRTAKTFEQFIKGKKATGELAAGVKDARDRLEDFVDIGASAGSTMLSILKAGQQTGDMITKGLRDQTNAAQKWTKSFEGQRSMTEFFQNMQPAMIETAKLAKDLGGVLARTAQESSIDVLVHQLRADLLPTLEDVMISTNRNMGPLLIETVVNIMQAFAQATAPNGPVTLMVNGINQLAQAFTKLIEVFPILRELLGLMAMFRVARLTGALVGTRMIVDTMRRSRTGAEVAADRMQQQASIRAGLGRAFPDAMMQPMGPHPVTGRHGFIPGPKVLDPSRLPENVRRDFAFALMGEEQRKGIFERIRTGEFAKDVRFAREQGANRFAAIRGGFAGSGIGRVGGMVGLMAGGQVAEQAAGAMGASGRVQSIIGMAGMGAGMGAMMAAPGGVTMPVGAAIGGVVGGLAGLGMSLLGASKKVDDFANQMLKATNGLAATQQAVASLRRNQGQLRLGVRGAEIELRQAVKARDDLTRGMTDVEFNKFQKTDTFKAAQLRVDTARTNLNELRNAIKENTEQLRLANNRLKQDIQRPTNFLQMEAGKAGARLSDISKEMQRVRNRADLTPAQRDRALERLQQERRQVIVDFSRKMTQASREAAANSQPYFTRMFANAAAIAMRDGRIGQNLTAQVRRATQSGLGQPGSLSGSAPASARRFQGDRAVGGRITWGTPTADASPAMLAKDEFVVTRGGEAMLEGMTFPGVLDWLEGAQPPHFAKGGRMRKFANGGFARRAILAPFRGSFSSGFSAGASGARDAIAGLYSDLVAAGTFAAQTTGGGDDSKSRNYSSALKKAAPPVRRLAKIVEGLLKQGIPFVEGGGHGPKPGPSKPTWQSVMNANPTWSKQQAWIYAKEAKAGLDRTGFVRMALARGGFGDPGAQAANLYGVGKDGPGRYLTVYTQAGKPSKAFIRIAGTDFGYMGQGKHPTLGSRNKGDNQGYVARRFGNYRSGGRVGIPRRYAMGGRVGGGIAMPTVTGAAGDAANQAWANGVMGYLQSLTTASLNSISGAVASLGSQVVALTQKADTSPAGQQLLARVSALLEAAQFALGERLGAMQKEIEDMGKRTALRRTRLERSLREREISPDSPGGLAQELTQLRREAFGENGLRARIAKQRALLAQARGTDEEQQIQDMLDELIAQNAENQTQRVLTRRALQRARDQKPVDQAGFALENRQFGLDRLQLQQRIQGRTGSAANAELQRYITNQMLPVLKAREKAAQQAMAREAARSGRGSEAFRAAQDQWQAAVLATLEAQAQAAEATKNNTAETNRKLSGALGISFMGENTTDLIGSGTGI